MKTLNPQQIAFKYVHGHSEALTDNQEKKDMASDITEYGDKRVRSALSLLQKLLKEESGIKIEQSIINRVKK